MGNTNFLSLVGERIKSFFVLMKEGYGFKDKVIILEYYLKSPLHFFNYYLGIKNSRTLKGDVLIKNKYGLFFCGNNFSSLFGSCSMCEPVMRKYMKLEKGIAIDAGANCGMFTIPLARMLGDKGKVISIEPDKKNIEILRKNIEINHLKNVEVVEKGCFSKKDRMTFYLDDIGMGGHSLLKKGEAKKETIEVDTIDNMLKDLEIDRVDFIKIDVMGVELETLRGAEKTLEKSHPKIVFELLHKEDKDKVYAFLSKYNYKIKQITDWNHVAV
jgi:FkbM family methyltransferase